MQTHRHAHLTITGRVQGVWFRAGTKETADSLGIKGWVRNMPDGSVEVDAIGAMDAMGQFIQWCYQGPPGAKVKSIDIEELEPADDPQGFRILR